VTRDEATGDLTYGTWTVENADSVVPGAKAGYAINPASVEATTIVVPEKATAAEVSKLLGTGVTDVSVVYTPTIQKAIIKFIDENGSELIPSISISGFSGTKTDERNYHSSIQDVINMNYTIVQDNVTGASFDYYDDKVQEFKVVFKGIPVIKITTPVIPVDESGNPIPNTTPTKVTDVPGTVIVPDDIPGYTAKPGQNPKVPETTGEETKIIYTANMQHATVQYLDENGKVLGKDLISGLSDSLIDQAGVHQGIQNAINQGYNLNVNGTLNATFDHDDATNQVFKAILTAVPIIKITTPVIPVDANGNPIPNTTPTKVTDVPGTVIVPDDIPGYTVKPGQNPKVPETTGGVTNIVYTPNEQTAIIHYVDEDGNFIGADTILVGNSDSKLDETEIRETIQAVVNKHYTIIQDNVAGASFDHDDSKVQEFTIVFKVIPFVVNPSTPDKTVDPTDSNHHDEETITLVNEGTNGTTTISDNTNHSLPKTNAAVSQSAVENNGNVVQSDQTSQKLPETGEKKSTMNSILGVLAIGLTTIFTIAKKKNGKNEE
jgi:LPXTG-motif cell wall-anchored protein